MPEPYRKHANNHRRGGADPVGVVVEETDGAPSVKNVTKIKVSVGDLADNGDGSVTIATGGVAGSAHALTDTNNTVSGRTAGDILIATAATTYGFSPLSGDATMNGTGIVTVAATHSGSAHHSSVTAGSGIGVIGQAVALGPLTSDWAQTGLKDILHSGAIAHGNVASPLLAVTIAAAPITGIYAAHIDGVTKQAGLLFTQHSSTVPQGVGPTIYLAKSRGSYASQSVVASGDLLGGIRMHGHDGTDYEIAAAIHAYVDGTPGADDMPGRLVFYTTPDGSAISVERMRINNAGGVSIGGAATADPFAVLDLVGTGLGLLVPRMTTANAPVSATNGLIWYDSTTGKFRAREGGADVDLRSAAGGDVATDVIWDAAGDLAVGSGADTAVRLALTVPAANILEVLGVVNGETTATWKAVHDGTAPADLAAVAAAGTALTAAHRDHVHLDPVVAHAAAADPYTGYRLESADHTHASTGAQGGIFYNEVRITVETPGAAEDIIMWKATEAVTITAISACVIGGTSVTINPKHGTTVAGTDLVLTAEEVVATANTDGEHINGTGTAMATTLSDVTLVAGEILRLVTTAIVGVPTALHVTIQYRRT